MQVPIMVANPGMPSTIYNMATAAATETVALALRELALSSCDQYLLSEFVTEYFTSEEHEYSSGKQKHSE